MAVVRLIHSGLSPPRTALAHGVAAKWAGACKAHSPNGQVESGRVFVGFRLLFSLSCKTLLENGARRHVVLASHATLQTLKTH